MSEIKDILILLFILSLVLLVAYIQLRIALREEDKRNAKTMHDLIESIQQDKIINP